MAKTKTIGIKYEGVSFNADDAASKPLNQFIKEQGGTGLSKEQLTEAHGLAKKAVSKTKKIIKAGAVEEEAGVTMSNVPDEVSKELNKSKETGPNQ